MKVSRNWLKNFFEVELQSAEALSDALTFHAFEIDGVEKAGNDDVLDVKVTPNRGHDCLSHRGIAKELAAILKLPMKADVDPLAKKPDLSKTTDEVSVTIADPKLCKRYIAGYIKGVKVGPSPEWLKASLEAIGQRSINNVVDATNLVMFNIGQPLHAFDAGKLVYEGGYRVAVRAANDGECMLALDNKEYTLNSSMLVITDARTDKPIGIAGVKGGTPAAITESTKDIIIESANFDGPSVRKTAQALKLRTDASARFEQVLSPELAAYGMQQVVDLIVRIAGGEVVGYADVYPEPQQEKRVSVSVEKINNVLGIALTGAEVADVFQRLGFAYKEERGVFEVVVPFIRLDLEIPEDLVEEVGRIIGYEQVPATPLPAFEKKPEVNKNFYAAEKAREELQAQGYSEVFTSVFAEAGERVVANKADGVRPYLRNSLVPGLIDALRKNIPNKELLNLKQIKLFEIGTVWKDGKEAVMIGTAEGDSKGENTKEGRVSEKLLEPIEAQAYDDLPLSTTERYQTFSRYPYMVRDIALWTPASMNKEEVPVLIKNEAGPLLYKISLFDTFEKEGRTSLAFRLIFQSFERTLTEIEVNAVMEKVSAALKAQGFEIR